MVMEAPLARGGLLVQDSKGDTPFHWAAQKRVLFPLLVNLSPPEIVAIAQEMKNFAGKTPLAILD